MQIEKLYVYSISIVKILMMIIFISSCNIFHKKTDKIHLQLASSDLIIEKKSMPLLNQPLLLDSMFQKANALYPVQITFPDLISKDSSFKVIKLKLPIQKKILHFEQIALLDSMVKNDTIGFIYNNFLRKNTKKNKDSLLTLISKYPNNKYAPKVIYTIGLSDVLTRKSDDAIEMFKHVISRYPSTAEAYLSLKEIETIYTNLGDAQTFIPYAATTPITDYTAADQEKSMYEAASNLFKKGDYSGAISQVSAYLDKFQTHQIYKQQASDILVKSILVLSNLNLTSIEVPINKPKNSESSSNAILENIEHYDVAKAKEFKNIIIRILKSNRTHSKKNKTKSFEKISKTSLKNGVKKTVKSNTDDTTNTQILKSINQFPGKTINTDTISKKASYGISCHQLMRLGQQTVLRVFASFKLDSTEIKKKLKNANTEGGKGNKSNWERKNDTLFIYTNTIDVYDSLRVTVKYDTSIFELSPNPATENQKLSLKSENNWIWTIKAKSLPSNIEGTSSITVIFDPHTPDGAKPIKDETIDIVIKFTLFDRINSIYDYLWLHIGYTLTTIVSILGIFYAGRRSKKRKQAKDQSKTLNDGTNISKAG